MKRLQGKTALISGAAKGMGAAEARLFAEEGAQVIVADVDDAAGRGGPGGVVSGIRRGVLYDRIRNGRRWRLYRAVKSAGPVGRKPILAKMAPAAWLAWFHQASSRGRRISDSTSCVCSPSRGGRRRTRPGLSENWTGIRGVTRAPSVGCS